MKKYFLPLLIAATALTVSASAAFYSVTGLTKLFAGAAFAVAIMAGSLEVAKLVIATLLHQYWESLNKVLRTYLIVATGILMLITSAGIYGFLSSAYQETAGKDEIVTQQIEALQQKKQLYIENRDAILKEKQSLAELKSSLSKSASTQYTDRKGNLVVSSNKASLKQLESTGLSDEKLSNKLDIINDSVLSLDTKILLVKTNSNSATELGPLKYLAKLTNVSMDKIINWFILTLVFVFDPLAIALVIAANFAFAKIKNEVVVEPVQLNEEDVDWLKADLGPLEEEPVYEVYGETNAPEPEPDTKEDWIIEAEEPAPVDPLTEQKAAIVAKMDAVRRNDDFSPSRQKQLLEQLRRELASLENKNPDRIDYWV